MFFGKGTGFLEKGDRILKEKKDLSVHKSVLVATVCLEA